jgi:K+-transporting ATPase A subunit
MIAAVVVILGAIEYFPALCLGPVIEHLYMIAGKLV